MHPGRPLETLTLFNPIIDNIFATIYKLKAVAGLLSRRISTSGAEIRSGRPLCLKSMVAESGLEPPTSGL